MNMEYIVFDKTIEVYYGILNNAVDIALGQNFGLILINNNLKN